MSTGKTENIRRARPKKRPSSNHRPAPTNREALGRWALKGGYTGDAKQLPAYTAEHYAADVASGAIGVAVRGCPHTRPEIDCTVVKPGPRRRSEVQVADPDVTWSVWSRYAKFGAWTADGGRPVLKLVFDRLPICFDCRIYLYWEDRQAFFAAAGFDHGLGYVRAARGVVDQWSREAAAALQTYVDRQDLADMDSSLADPVGELVELVDGDGRISTYLEGVRAADELFASERDQLIGLVGELPDELLFAHRFEQATFLAIVRHCVTCNIAARTNLPAPEPQIRLMG